MKCCSTNQCHTLTEKIRLSRVSCLFTFLLLLLLPCGSRGNSPPKFLLDENQNGGVVIPLKEGADTPPGTVIYHAKGFDPDGDPLTFGVISKGDDSLVEVITESNNEASIVLKRYLDAEVEKEHQLVLTLTDNRLGQGNYMTQSLLIIVEDVNDNAPIFRPHSPTIQIREHSATPLTVATLIADDKDSGIFGQVIYDLETDDDDPNLFSVTTVNGAAVLTLLGDLDFEKQSLYQLRIIAKDRANFGKINSAVTAILIKVQDIEDKRPEFVSVPSVSRIAEDVPTFTEVLKVRAVDGDRGINNQITYSIVQGPIDLFGITPESGIVYTQSKLDRESELSSNGAFILRIRAEEVGGGTLDYVDTEVTIIIEDVNDETPTFRTSSYIGEISENSPKATPILFVGGRNIPEVFDHDSGTNGTFLLFLEDDQGIFEVTPNEGINEASFMIRVKEPSSLDFESVQVVNFTIVAREIVKDAPKESRAHVQVYVRDVNDNPPEFATDSYEVYIPENIQPGATIAWIKAEDKDSGTYGTQGIRYTGLNGPMADLLELDRKTGIISLGNSSVSTSVFDREKTNFHFLSVEARDDLGRGNRNTVELLIHLTDVNDNPPKFDQENYSVHLRENSLQFSEPFFVSATDSDENGTDNSAVRYTIVQGNSNGNFTIDSVSGQVIPVGIVDYEKIAPDADGNRVFNLTVRAYDLGTPQLTSDVLVKVFVLDENDHDPIFEEAFYRVNVREDTTSGTEVIQVFAQDLDGSNVFNEVVYRITSGAKDKFVIEPESGKILVSRGASLDPDLTLPRTSSYFLEVTAFDGGLGESRRFGVTNVNVSIDDVNNKAPVLNEDSLLPVVIKEDIQTGYFIRRIIANDPDQSAQLRFSIDFNSSEARNENGIMVFGLNVSDVFEIDSDTGELFTIAELDRETAESFKLVVLVQDINADLVASQFKPQIQRGSLQIAIDDVNDNSPIFKQNLYEVFLKENVPKDTEILTVTAEDIDQNRTITYNLEGSLETLKLIDVEARSGKVFIREKLDYEEITMVNFTIRAQDNGWPIRSSYVPVVIKILDENDNAPKFALATINITVREDTPPDTIVAKLQAEDKDSGEFGQITYFLDRTSANGKFKIDPESGELSIGAELLDREIQDKYTLIVQAYDNYHFGFPTGDSRHSFAQVVISVTDVNDQVPIFVEDDPSPHNCAIINEFHDTEEPILTARAIDGDDPRTPNGVVNYSIKAGNDLNLFRMEANGKLLPNKSLKGFYGNYSVTIQASDSGQPPNSAVKKFPICIQDFNDNAPRFISPPKNFTVRIPENTSLGAEVIAVQAIDIDIGSNGAIRYRLRPDPLGNYRNFDIDPETGMITLTQSLDRERQKMYEIRVEAFDLGIPTSLSTDLDMKIYVKNINDHEPQFLIEEFTANFTEHQSPGKERVKVVGTIDRDELDEDEETEISEVCYFIVSSDAPKGLFAVHPTKHELMTTKELDREKRDAYNIIIQATEDCIEPQGDNDFNDTAISSSMLKIKIYVNDIDDNPPEFMKRIFTGGIASDNDYGSSVLTVKARDRDINALLEYSVIGDILPSDNSENLEGIKNPPFLLDKATGDIILNFDPQKGMKGYFAFHVGVRDAFGHTDKATVQIYLVREDQRIKFVFRSHPAEIRSRMDDFRKVLSTATNSIVNVDKYVMHEDDTTKTDAFLHFVNPDDNSVMEVDTVLKMIDYKTEALDDIFKEFNVLHTEGADPKVVKAMAQDTVIMIGLVGLNVFQTIVIALILSFCCNQRKKYRRRLKATTIGNTIISDTLLKKVQAGSNGEKVKSPNKEFVPNTNKHASEGSNPIWMTSVAYDNMTFEHDLDDDDLDDNFIERLQQGDNNLDSLDVNVLNGTNKTNTLNTSDDGYAGSTIRVGSSITRMILSSSPPDTHRRSQPQSRTGSGSSGLGSASSRKNYAGLFHTQMPPVEKLGMDNMRNSKKNFYGFTTYDDDNIPRTEL